MKYEEPEELNPKTPAWFKEWHDKAFWHFKYRVESKLALHDRLLYVILAAILVAMITNIFI